MSIRQTAKNFGVTKATVEYWLNRSKGKRLDRVDWSNKPINVKTANNRVETCVEQCVLALRKELKEQSPLGEFGAAAIQREMEKRQCPKAPSRATSNRILKRNGVLDNKRRKRFPPPPIGWYLTNVERKIAERDSLDYVEDLYVKGGQTFHVDKHWKIDWQTPPQGTVVFIRRTNDSGNVDVMGHTWVLDENWSNKLIRADVDLTNHEINFYRLRRRDPQNHIYIGTAKYHFPVRDFIED
jgi:hypothetical protein